MAITEELCSTIWNNHLKNIENNGITEHTDDVQFEDFSAVLDESNTYTTVEHIMSTTRNNTWKKIYINVIEFFKENPSIDKLVISISGGVDSMLLSLILSHYCKFHDIELIMLHLNYNNRDTCEKEIKFLLWWSKQINSKLYVKSFDITRSRNSKERALYEDLTRRIRYSVYQHFKSPIFLGHNLDDCYENVFSNLSKRIHFDNLFGMSSYAIESDIPIVRPMINITKKDILYLSHTIGLPYLEDSTPAWSNRGKMRDSLIPQISEFNAQILPGISEYINYTSKLERHWNRSFDRWIQKNIQLKTSDDEKVLTISKEDDFYNDNYDDANFWIKIWFQYNLPTRPSNKSVKSMIKFLTTKRYNTNFELNGVSRVFNKNEDDLILTVCNTT